MTPRSRVRVWVERRREGGAYTVPRVIDVEAPRDLDSVWHELRALVRDAAGDPGAPCVALVVAVHPAGCDHEPGGAP